MRTTVARNSRRHKDPIRWRGHEVTRIEAFSDAVLAFAVTILIVALEVPETYEELIHVMRMFIPFGLTFLLLFGVWYTQNMYFRRYGLHDFRTIALNGALLFTTLFYVYPVKFLFTAWFGGNHHHNIDSIEKFRTLFVVYSAGFAVIYLLFALMYRNAYQKREQLQLTEAEAFETQTHVYARIATAFGGIIAVVIAMLPDAIAVFAGFGYILIWPSMAVVKNIRSKEYKKRFAHAEVESILPVEDPVADVVNSESLN